MAEETLTVDAQLNELFGTPETPAAKAEGAETPKGDPAKPVPAASPAPVEAKPEEADPLLKALEEIEEEQPAAPKEDKPVLSPDQQAVLEAIPNIEVATNLYQAVQNYDNFTGALSSGKFTDVEAMLTKWNPDVLDGWQEHIYQKFVASGAWVDRFIAEAEGKGPTKEFTKLQKEVNSLKEALTAKTTTSKAEQEAAATQAAFQGYNKHVNDLFEKINFNAADRRWVTADLNQRIAADPKVLAAVKSGNAKAVNPLFKAACREYLTRDKEVVVQGEKKVEKQLQKKVPLGGASAETDAIPEDINQVKKEDRETWTQRALDKLFKK